MRHSRRECDDRSDQNARSTDRHMNLLDGHIRAPSDTATQAGDGRLTVIRGRSRRGHSERDLRGRVGRWSGGWWWLGG